MCVYRTGGENSNQVDSGHCGWETGVCGSDCHILKFGFFYTLNAFLDAQDVLPLEMVLRVTMLGFFSKLPRFHYFLHHGIVC